MNGMFRSAALLLVIACTAPAQPAPEVRFLCLAPSPYTGRHDATRAGLGIYLSLQRVAGEHKLNLRTSFYDAVPVFENEQKARALLRGPRVLLFGSSTWAQGSAYYIRRFFEMANREPLTGAAVSAWATAGGAHTGGELVIEDALRTAMGMGAQVFTLGQKYMVFTTDERLGAPDGEFTLLDCWYMDQFARGIAAAALAEPDRARTAALAARLGVQHEYWRGLPRSAAELEPRFGELRARLNGAADARSDAWRKLAELVSKP
jgi:hypothetical protein